MGIRDLLRGLFRRRRPVAQATTADARRPALPPGANRGVIGLGDLLRALARLDAKDEATAARIIRSLGFAQRDPNPPERLRGAYDQTRSPHRRRTPIGSPPPPLGAPPFSGAIPPLELPERALEAELTPLEPAVTAEPPEWLDVPLPAEQPSPTAARRAPLFPRRTAPAVLSAAVATRRPGSEPDLQRIIAGFTRGERMRDLPRLPVARLDRGIQLLLDVSEAMTPFRDDLTDLGDALERVVGRARCQVFEFAGDPAKASRWDEAGKERDWKAERGRPVVLATDFGIAAPPAARDRITHSGWLEFAAKVRKAGCPLMAFVPLPPSRWPVRLARQITLIHWDPRTTAGAVRRLVGAGHEIPA